MIRRCRSIIMGAVVGASIFASPARAQGFDPRPSLGQMITAFQRCGPPAAYQLLSPQMFQIVAAQTNGAGCYRDIAGAGPVLKMEVLQQADFPIGPLFLVRVTHQGGPVDWFVGFNRFSGKIEYLSYQQIQGTPPSIQSGPAPSAGGPGTDATPPVRSAPRGGTGDKGGSQPEECSMFPTMCK